MDYVEVQKEAKKIEHLAEDALREKKGEHAAESLLLEELERLQKDPKMLSAVRLQLRLDNMHLDLLPTVDIEMRTDGKVDLLTFTRSSLSGDRYLFGQVNVQEKVGMKTMHRRNLYPNDPELMNLKQ